MTTQINVGEKLKNLGKKILTEMKQGKNPEINIPIRSLSNIYFDEKEKLIRMGNKMSKRYFLNVAHVKKFMQTLLVARQCKLIIEKGVTISIRDLYYALKHTISNTNENTFDEQSESDPIIEDLEATLDVLREELHLNADRKGYIAGLIKIKDRGDSIDCSHMGSGGWAIPSNVEPEMVEFVECSAEYVLVIEKDAVWQRLNEDKFWKKNKCIIVTGKGQPARGARRLIHRMANELKLPVYVLTDADPWGYYIYSVIKQGSINLSFLSKRLALPSAKFLGLTTLDLKKFKIDESVTIKLNDKDKKRIKELMKYVWFKPIEWQNELRNMLNQNYKLELEALSSKGIRFITTNYLPRKIETEDFLP